MIDRDKVLIYMYFNQKKRIVGINHDIAHCKVFSGFITCEIAVYDIMLKVNNQKKEVFSVTKRVNSVP